MPTRPNPPALTDFDAQNRRRLSAEDRGTTWSEEKTDVLLLTCLPVEILQR